MFPSARPQTEQPLSSIRGRFQCQPWQPAERGVQDAWLRDNRSVESDRWAAAGRASYAPLPPAYDHVFSLYGSVVGDAARSGSQKSWYLESPDEGVRSDGVSCRSSKWKRRVRPGNQAKSMSEKRRPEWEQSGTSRWSGWETMIFWPGDFKERSALPARPHKRSWLAAGGAGAVGRRGGVTTPNAIQPLLRGCRRAWPAEREVSTATNRLLRTVQRC